MPNRRKHSSRLEHTAGALVLAVSFKASSSSNRAFAASVSPFNRQRRSFWFVTRDWPTRLWSRRLSGFRLFKSSRLLSYSPMAS